jgi:hypothetical protein
MSSSVAPIANVASGRIAHAAELRSQNQRLVDDIVQEYKTIYNQHASYLNEKTAISVLVRVMQLVEKVRRLSSEEKLALCIDVFLALVSESDAIPEEGKLILRALPLESIIASIVTASKGKFDLNKFKFPCCSS